MRRTGSIGVLVGFILVNCLSVASAYDYTKHHLSWKAPVRFSNGEPLSPRFDLNKYMVYYGPARAKVRQNSITVSPSQTRISLGLLNTSAVQEMPVVYLGVTAVSKSGWESDLSEIVFFLP